MTIDSRYKIINRLNIDQKRARNNLITGLRANPATIEPKYFYDELGCALYGAICQLDEYYPTRTEAAIFSHYRHEVATVIGEGGSFVDLGAGDCQKALAWLPHLRPQHYLAVDIAGPTMETALGNMAPEFPQTKMFGLATDFSHTLDIPADLLAGKVTLFYPGSSIGNFIPEDAIRFLREMRAITAASGGGLLIGVDAKKAKSRLDAAYDDALGVTAAFNLNALRHINRVLSCDFDVAQWRHVGYYNEVAGRVEMHLASIADQTVMIDDVPRLFAKGEKIHSENSYKYHRNEFEALLRSAGFNDIQCWTNADQEFWVFYASGRDAG